jgi:hypothetical protein
MFLRNIVLQWRILRLFCAAAGWMIFFAPAWSGICPLFEKPHQRETDGRARIVMESFAENID